MGVFQVVGKKMKLYTDGSSEGTLGVLGLVKCWEKKEAFGWILHGLKVVAEYQMGNIELASDSDEAISRLLKNIQRLTPPYLSLVGERNSLVAKLGISIMHALVDGNKVADKLSQGGSVQDFEWVMAIIPPKGSTGMFTVDLASVAFEREWSYL